MKISQKVTSQEFEKGLELILKASKQRREEVGMSDEHNLAESVFAFEYLVNPPEKTGRKEL